MLKDSVKSLAKRFGYEILGFPRAHAVQRSLAGLLRQERINLVLDVGANAGQFADELWECGYKERVISFEPLTVAHTQLRRNAEKHPNWTIADRTACGSEMGSATIHISKINASSSILEMLPTHLEAFPQTMYVGTETVPVNRLDDLYTMAPSDRAALKIDVQGYEHQVLDGAPQVLARCRAVMIEMSLVPLYEGQVLVRELWDRLEALGFDAWSLEPVFRDPVTGRMLQVDGLFVRRNEGV